jgi:hypothetical protein
MPDARLFIGILERLGGLGRRRQQQQVMIW